MDIIIKIYNVLYLYLGSGYTDICIYYLDIYTLCTLPGVYVNKNNRSISIYIN